MRKLLEDAEEATRFLRTNVVQNVLDPEINAATIRLLNRAGAEVVSVPGCCGSIVHHLGREGESHSLATALIERLHHELERGVDAIVVNASGCGTQAKDYGFMFRNDAAVAAKRFSDSGSSGERPVSSGTTGRGG